MDTAQRRTLFNDTSVSYVAEYMLVPKGGKKCDMPVRVIDVPLEHVRQRASAFNDPVGAEHAIVIASRLPKRGGASVTYLVSLEHRYRNSDDDSSGFIVDVSKSHVRFVVLKSWRFSCLSAARNFLKDSQWPKLMSGLSKPAATKMAECKEAIVEQDELSKKDFTNTLPSFEDDTDLPKVLKAALFRKLGFKGLLMDLDKDTLRLPPVTGAAVPYVARGNMLVPYYLRSGELAPPWYHGPLSDGGHDTALI
jgi:hypothetical protein